MASKKGDDGPSKEAAQEVARLVAASRRTQKQIADYLTRRVGRPIQHYHISRMITAARAVRSDEMDALREIAEAPEGSAMAAPQLTETSDVVPVYGYANAAGPILRINEDQRLGVVPIHPAQKGSRSAFAFICFGDSVSPRLNHGELGYAIRNRSPFPGQLAVIELTNGDALVKFYGRQDERTLFLTQLQGDKRDLSVPLREVAAIHAVVGSTFGPG